ncbi:MAG: ribonuclease HII [Candidatus Bilamarchaeum sp.]|jgi:ribonuclease HII
MSKISGVDEAGRGCVIGPLIVAIATCERKNEKTLKKYGKKDSKQLTKEQRETTLVELNKICTFSIQEITAQNLNQLMKKMSLNEIEASAMAELCKKNPESDTVIDMPDRYGRTFRARMERFGVTKFEGEHKADENYPIVAAASIMAKVTRDNLIEKIKTEVGFDFGSGYPSDPRTISALIDPIKRKKLEPYIRQMWKTLDNLKQKKLFDDEITGNL